MIKKLNNLKSKLSSRFYSITLFSPTFKIFSSVFGHIDTYIPTIIRYETSNHKLISDFINIPLFSF